MPMFIPKRVAYLSSSIAHYERWFLMRADFVAPPFASATSTPNHAMQPTTGRRTAKISMTPTSHLAATRALASGG
jgi:hypothetical protein